MTSYDKMEYTVERLTPAFDLNNGLCDLVEAKLTFKDREGIATITIFVGNDGFPTIVGNAYTGAK